MNTVKTRKLFCLQCGYSKYTNKKGYYLQCFIYTVGKSLYKISDIRGLVLGIISQLRGV